MTNSSDVYIENVTVHAAGGMGLIVERTDNIHLDGMVVTSTEDRLVSTQADATQFIGCKGTIRLENRRFEHMLDDGINVHGAYVKVEEHLGDRELLCEISHFQQWGLTFAEPGDNNNWYESGAVQDVTIRNNVFDNIGYEVTERYPLLASPLFTPQQRMGEGQYHRNIRFTDNTIRSLNGLPANARSVRGLNITGNTVELSTDYPAVSEGAAIVLEYCDEVTLENNEAKGFGRTLAITRSADTADIEIHGNDGFEVE